MAAVVPAIVFALARGTKVWQHAVSVIRAIGRSSDRKEQPC
jgi:hypothetical protein